ncbi:MAG: transposase [Acidobacteriia bacterium]|nr:transposase [Terriglobia bacterium]
MRNHQPLKQILVSTRGYWDRPETRPAVRQNFDKMTLCGTPALGAEIYASKNEEKRVCHTCKSRACPGCGYRATLLWQREQWAALPDIPYAGIVFTMPSALWPIFEQNRHLLHDLPGLGATVIQQWARNKYGVRLLIMVVPHTFGGYLNFNTHLHVLVSAGGLKESEGRWITPLRFDKDTLMRMWRYAVITYLREALKANVLKSDSDGEDLAKVLTAEYERPRWITLIRPSMSKRQFLGYAARYARRPPIAQSRILTVTNHEVEFRTKDKKQKRWVTVRHSIEEFVAALARHVPDRYRNAIRYFGLLAPRSKGLTSAALFALVGQSDRPHPKRLSWRESLRRYFGVDPLIDRCGQSMHWIRRLKPAASQVPGIQ